MTKEALKLALEGAANYIDALGGDSRKYRQALAEHVFTALRDRLAQPEQEPVAWQWLGRAQPEQEPVAWQWLGSAHFRKQIPRDADVTAWNPLYTLPPQRKPLTNEEMWQLWNSQGDDAMEQQAAITFARAIEAAHGIGGEA